MAYKIDKYGKYGINMEEWVRRNYLCTLYSRIVRREKEYAS